MRVPVKLSLCLQLSTAFFRIGIFTLGGGYAMLPLIHREVVENKKWLGEREYLDALAIAQSLPGPMVVNTSVFVGYKTAGTPGALFAVLGTVAPAFLCMVVIASFFTNIRTNPTVEAVFKGIRPAVTALIAGSVWSLGKSAGLTPLNVVIGLGAALAVWLAGVSPAWIVLGLAVLGLLLPLGKTPPPADDLEPSTDRELEK